MFQSYLISKLLKTALLINSFFIFFWLIFNFINTAYLFLELDWFSLICFLLLHLLYFFYIFLPFSILLALPSFIYFYENSGLLYTFYNLGIRKSQIVKALIKGIFVISVVGMVASPFLNYQKISYLYKFLKVKLREEGKNLFEPGKINYLSENGEIYFEKVVNNTLKEIIIRQGRNFYTAEKGYFSKGSFILHNVAGFINLSNDTKLFFKAKSYSFSLFQPGEFPHFSNKKLLSNMFFSLAIYFLLLPFSFLYLNLFLGAKKERISLFLYSALFSIFLFVIASIFKIVSKKFL